MISTNCSAAKQLSQFSNIHIDRKDSINMQTNDESKLNQNKLTRSVKASLFSCVEPVASMVLTAVWMKVSFTTPDLIGTLFVIATIIILAVPTKKRQK